jgi:cytochrome c oxidase subunit 3
MNLQQKPTSYYVPDQSYWPIIGSIALLTLMTGTGMLISEIAYGKYVAFIGLGLLVFLIAGWFSTVVNESLSGLYSEQMDRSFRLSMLWFIFSEVMFFAAFFGALFYVRIFTINWLGGEGAKGITNMLWPNFSIEWPLLSNPDPSKYQGPEHAMGAWGLPAINTMILLTSGATITYAHHALLHNNNKGLVKGLLLTVLLGVLFLICQVFEYYEAYHHLGLTIDSGIYGTTFFMLTGFHGLHVTIGTIMLAVVLMRAYKGHFTADNHFAFEASAWYWHFVDVVWLILFVFVYWI